MVPTGRSERDLHYHTQLQLPSDDADWTSLTPTLTGTESPEVGRVVDRLNEEHANSPPQTIDEVCDLVQDLCACPPTSPVEEPAATTSPPPPYTWKPWQKLCDHPCSWPGGPQLLQFQLEVCPTPPLLQPSALGRATV